jgi:predicted ribosome quality control (RQC) complex YloA/Tae2 family protein
MSNRIKGRGSNPNSHGNNIKIESEKAIAKEITLYKHHWEIAKKLGGGNDRDHSKGLRLMADIAISAGADNIDKLFSTLPVLSKAKIALQMLLEQHENATEYAEGVLYDLEDLEIENAYNEARTDLEIKENKGAWIV